MIWFASDVDRHLRASSEDMHGRRNSSGGRRELEAKYEAEVYMKSCDPYVHAGKRAYKI